VSRRAALALLLVGLVAGPAGARELWQRGEAKLEVTGSLRELVQGTRGTRNSEFEQVLAANPVSCSLVASFPDCPVWETVNETPVVTSLTRLRLRFDARATRHLSAVVSFDDEWRAGRLDTFESELGRALRPPPFDDLTWNLVARHNFDWQQSLYRAYLFFESEHLELTVGRQRIPWGVGRLWNPIDRFNAIGPLAIQADESPGVDAVKARWLFSGFTYAEAVYALGHTRDDTRFAGRLHGVLHDVDYSAMAGLFEQAPTVGFDLASNLWNAAGRLEVVWTDPARRVRPFDTLRADSLPAYWQVVASVDYNFDIGTGLYTLVEYLYNGNALGFGRGAADGLLGLFQERDQATPLGPMRVVAPGSADLFGGSQVVTNAPHLTGAQLSYDLTPELRGTFLTLYDWQGRSASFFPALTYSPTGWLELTLGVQSFAGSHLSQFGDAKALGFLLADVFF
jgi:hypothetical protein